MNVTLKLPDEPCKEARHRAVDGSKSLSAWLTDLVRRALEPKPAKQRKTLAELLGRNDIPAEHVGKELPPADRKAFTVREFPFKD